MCIYIYIYIYLKDAYWMKMCLLNEKMPIDRKCTYWIKICPLTENGLLKGHNLFGINSCSHSFGNFFSFIFLKNTKNLWVFSKITLSLLSLNMNERIQFLKYFLSHRSKFSSLSLCFCLGFFFFFFFFFFFLHVFIV